jgi:hypothetical protein
MALTYSVNLPELLMGVGSIKFLIESFNLLKIADDEEIRLAREGLLTFLPDERLF